MCLLCLLTRRFPSFSVVFFDDSMKIFVFSFSLCVFVYVYVVCVFVEIRASLVVFAVCCFRRSSWGIGFGGCSKSKRRLSPMFARRFGRNERKPRRIKRKRRRTKEIDDRENEHCSSYYSRDLLLLLLNRCRFKMMVRCASLFFFFFVVDDVVVLQRMRRSASFFLFERKVKINFRFFKILVDTRPRFFSLLRSDDASSCTDDE